MFKNQSNPTKIILSGTYLFLLLMGCQPTANQGIEDAFATETIVGEQDTALQTAAPIVPTRSITQTATSTWTPVPTATSSPTPQPTQMPLPSAVTPTPWPTLPPDEAARKVLSLLEDNQNPDCLLPCWWGATPGQTHWQDIEPFLKSLAQDIYYSSSEASFGAEVHLPLPDSDPVTKFSEFRTFFGWKESGVIYGIAVDSFNISGYDPVTMMTLYGVPDEVWLKTFSELLPGEVLPFHLIIVYQEQGISFHYYLDASGTNETVTACFEPGVVEIERPDLFPVGPRIYLWEPGQPKAINEITNTPGERYFPLGEKTDLTPETLYEKFTDPHEQSCIDTPADLWIDP